MSMRGRDEVLQEFVYIHEFILIYRSLKDV